MSKYKLCLYWTHKNSNLTTVRYPNTKKEAREIVDKEIQKHKGTLFEKYNLDSVELERNRK